MHRSTLFSWVAAAMSIAVTITVARADTTLNYTISGGDGGELVMVISGNRAAMQMNAAAGEDGRFVFDGEADRMWMVLDSERQYMDMEQMVAGLGGLTDMLSGMMENLPEDAQATLGGLLGDGGEQKGESPQMEKTGKTDEVAGVTCEVFNTTVIGDVAEICIADPGDLEINAADFDTLNRMMEKQLQMAKQMGEMLGSDALSFGPASLEGVPVRSRYPEGSSRNETTELTAVSQSADAAVLQIPEDYQLVAMPGG